MHKPNKRFGLRIYSRFPVQISMMYLGQDSAGQGIVRELSRVGCRTPRQQSHGRWRTLSVRLSLPTYPKPVLIKPTTVQWVKGLEFGVAFGHRDAQQADRLQGLLDDLRCSGSYGGRAYAVTER